MGERKHQGSGNVRTPHWVKPNEQNRIPKRWIAFDTEARTKKGEHEEVQSWRMGAAVRWRRDTRNPNVPESGLFVDPIDLWMWVDGFCVPETRTVVTAHNLGYDIRISNALDILPRLGWKLEWSNLDRNVSAMVWRSDHGTLVFSDLFTWLPYPLKDIGSWLGYEKGEMPDDTGTVDSWNEYCLRDADIVRRAVQEIVGFIESDDLGNWQPTGAGSAYSMWRHKFMRDKVLVHDDAEALERERRAMHTGRAEAWRHGKVREGIWYEVDMKSAYTWIASQCSLPAKFKYSGRGLTVAQFKELSKVYAICADVEIQTVKPVVPHYNGERTLWPSGHFRTSLWDVELEQALSEGASVKIHGYSTYVRRPILSEWADYILDRVAGDVPVPSQVVRKWLKHCGRALIGRLSLRIPMWEYWGQNVEGITGISYHLNGDTGQQTRMLHIGHEVFAQTERKEAKDSLPQITGWIMAECRMRLWRAMETAGFDNIAHVDTDSVLVNADGLRRLRDAYGALFDTMWQIKGKWSLLTVYGPRNYRTGHDRKVSGVPRKATEIEPGKFTGELWLGVGADLESGRVGTVTIKEGFWNVRMSDPRRLDAPGAAGRTTSVVL